MGRSLFFLKLWWRQPSNAVRPPVTGTLIRPQSHTLPHTQRPGAWPRGLCSHHKEKELPSAKLSLKNWRGRIISRDPPHEAEPDVSRITLMLPARDGHGPATCVSTDFRLCVTGPPRPLEER